MLNIKRISHFLLLWDAHLFTGLYAHLPCTQQLATYNHTMATLSHSNLLSPVSFTMNFFWPMSVSIKLRSWCMSLLHWIKNSFWLRVIIIYYRCSISVFVAAERSSANMRCTSASNQFGAYNPPWQWSAWGVYQYRNTTRWCQLFGVSCSEDLSWRSHAQWVRCCWKCLWGDHPFLLHA